MGSLSGNIWGMRPFNSDNHFNPTNKKRRSRDSKPSNSVDPTPTARPGHQFPLKQAATAATLALTGDTIAQLRQRWLKNKHTFSHSSQTKEVLGTLLTEHDWLRAVRMTSYGFLFYGPGSYAWYQFLDRCMPKQNIQNVGMKHPGEQAIGNPRPAYSYEDQMGQPSFPFRRVSTSTLSNVQVFELDNDLSRRTYPRRAPRLPLPLSPRHEGFLRNNPAPVESSEESKLTPEEQKKALSTLRKETYNPLLKRSLSSGSNYQVRDWAILSRQTELGNDNEHGKRCAICLEDLRIKEVVTLTPCNHMFHDDCIVPWVKSHGSCPVCRYVIVKSGRERREATAITAAVSNNPSDNHASTLVRGTPMYEIPGYLLEPRNGLTFMSGNINDGLLQREFISVVRAMEAAFGWDVVRPSLN